MAGVKVKTTKNLKIVELAVTLKFSAGLGFFTEIRFTIQTLPLIIMKVEVSVDLSVKDLLNIECDTYD